MDKKSIFRQESIDRALSPDQLDEYIRVSNPGILLVLIALVVLFASVLAWGFTGTLPETLTVNGIAEDDGQIVCFVDASALDKDIQGCKAQVAASKDEEISGVVSAVSPSPYSVAEIADQYESDWVTQMLVRGEYSYEVTIDLSSDPGHAPDGISSVTIITDEVKPISYLLNQSGVGAGR
jgi:hypothetical protein